MKEDTTVPYPYIEHIYSSLMEATPDCVKVLDLEGRLLHMNTPGRCAMEIDDFSSVADKKWWTLWPEEARQSIEQSLANAIRGEASSFEAFCPTFKGTPKWWDVSVSPVRDVSTGKIEQLLTVSRDVTYRKGIENDLQLSQTRLAMLHSIVSSPKLAHPDRLAKLLRLGIEQFDLEIGVIAQISDGIYRVELADTPDGSITPGFSCDEKDVICVETLRRNRLMAIESLAQSDWRTHAAYSKFGVEIYFGMPIPVEGQIFGTLCYISRQAKIHKFSAGDHEFLRLLAQTIGTEMTRQKALNKLAVAEAEFHAIFELSPVAMTQVSVSTGRFIRVNPKFCELTGYEATELMRLTPDDITHGDDRAGGAEARRALIAGEIDLYDREKRYVRKDGATIWISATSTLLTDLQGLPSRTNAVIQDITQRKLSEDSIREGAERLQLAIRAGDLGVWETDNEVGKRSWTPEAMALFGLDLPNGIGEFGGDNDEFRSRLHEEDRHLHDVYQRDLQETGSIKCEYRIVLPGGEIRWLTGGALVLKRDARGSATRVIHIATDITEKKNTAEQLRHAAAKYQTLFESMDQGYCIVDVIFDERDWAVDYRFVEVNPAFERHTRLVGATGRTIRSLVPDIEPHWAEMYGRVSRTGVPIRFVDRSHALQSRWFDVFAFKLVDEKSAKVAVLFSDVSVQKLAEQALQESEERFRQFANSIPQMAWIAAAGSKGEVIWFNQVWLDFTGSTQEEMLGNGWESVHHPEHIERVVKKFVHYVENSLDWEDTFPLRRKDGEYRWFLSRMKCIRDEDGKIKQLFGTNTDITKELALEGELRAAALELTDAHRRKDEFLATLAHELRNPLAPIRNGLQLMKLSGSQPSLVEQARAMMERQLTHMVHLVDDLMDASRISQGKLELRQKPIMLSDVLSIAIESSQDLIDQKGHQLIVQPSELPVMVNADVTRLSQVFQNLLNNAAKYTDRGGQIKLTVERHEASVSVTITDTGVGIASDQLPRIFDMFAQVDRSLDMAQGGLGIGLSLVKRLVDMHGGTVFAESDGAGKGSKFFVTLPLLDSPATSPDSDKSFNEDRPHTSLRILVVDDNRDAADSLSEMLELMGHTSSVAYDGQQGIDAACHFKPDVILLDIGMPNLNGYDACRIVRQQPWGKNVVVIAATGWGQEKDRSRTRDAGFDHHLVKPVDPYELLKTITELNVARR